MFKRLIFATGAKFARFVCRKRPNKVAENGLTYLREFLRKADNLNWDFDTNGERRVLEKVAMINPSCVFDVGANDGEWSTMARQYFEKAELHAFEIVPQTYKNLNKMLADDDLTQINCFGLSDSDGNIEISYTSRDSTVATANKITGMKLHEDFYDSQVVCEVKRGDTYMDDNGIESVDFLKIDTEGSDLSVIRGFGEKLSFVRVIQFEYGIFNIASRDLLIDFFHVLTAQDFLIGKVYPCYVDFFEYHFSREDFGGHNYVAVKKSEVELIRSLANVGD